MSKVLLYLRYMRISRCSLHKCQETLVLQIFIFLKLKYNYILFAFHLLPPISGKYRPHKLSQIQIFFFSLLLLLLPLFLASSTWCSVCFLYLFRCIPLVWESFLLWSLAHIDYATHLGFFLLVYAYVSKVWSFKVIPLSRYF